MAQYSTSHGSVQDASYKLAVRQKVCTVSSVRARIAALEENISSAANSAGGSYAPKPVLEKREAPSFKSDVTKTHRNSLGPPVPSHPKNVAMRSAVGADAHVSSRTSVSRPPATPAWSNYRRRESTAALKPETQRCNVSSFPRVYQSSRISQTQQNSVNKEQTWTDSYGRVEPPPRLPERQKPNYTRTCWSQMQSTKPCVQKRSLPRRFSLGNPPQKPSRPPSVDIHRFQRKASNPGPWMKIKRSVAPPPNPPPLRSSPSSNHAAPLSQQTDEDQNYDDVGFMKPSPLPSEEHPSKDAEADSSDDMYEELDNGWLKQAKESDGGKEDTKHGKDTKEEKATEGPGRVTTKGKAPAETKSDVNQGRDDFREEEEKEEPGFDPSDNESDVYQNTSADVCSELGVQTPQDDAVYNNTDNPDTRDSPTSDKNDEYGNVGSQGPQLPFDGYDIADDASDDSIYEVATV